MIRPTEEHLRRQVPEMLTAQRAGHHNRLERELLDPGRDIPPSAFALDDEQLAFLNAKGHHRQQSIGGYMANVHLENVDCPHRLGACPLGNRPALLPQLGVRKCEGNLSTLDLPNPR
jgi:hypothetical protein